MTNYSQLVTAWPDIPVRATYIQIHETAMHAMLRLFEAAERANIDNLFITSGFRSYDEQSRLYENAANSAYVMRPGHSEHQLGLAADILSTNSTAEMIGTQEAQWLAENAPQFGLILRYPYDKHDITNVPYEPWHFRYVGRVHAWIMGQYGFVLEEYIEFLQEHGNYTTTFENQAFYISYQKPRNGILFVPEHLDFTVSSANTGGYIVTAWE
ncbi:MAG: M15 family metallopeptidase [Oscillospiraceae bacterium]|nr:M15 family metallopeptidase [Oscillospiraceae bacterium]